MLFLTASVAFSSFRAGFSSAVEGNWKKQPGRCTAKAAWTALLERWVVGRARVMLTKWKICTPTTWAGSLGAWGTASFQNKHFMATQHGLPSVLQASVLPCASRWWLFSKGALPQIFKSKDNNTWKTSPALTDLKHPHPTPRPIFLSSFHTYMMFHSCIKNNEFEK